MPTPWDLERVGPTVCISMWRHSLGNGISGCGGGWIRSSVSTPAGNFTVPTGDNGSDNSSDDIIVPVPLLSCGLNVVGKARECQPVLLAWLSNLTGDFEFPVD